ncbi:peptidylprolyl isomerase [Lacunimicrobium album]
MKLPLNGKVMLPVLAAFVFVGCIRWTETSKPEVTEFAPAIKEEKAKKPTLPSADSFKVKFETSKGDVIVQVHPEWAPLGAAHFKELVEAGLYDEARFFRVVPGFMAQFGIAADPNLQAQYRDAVIQDDPVKVSNKRGKVTFATSGPNSRSTQLFINYGDNSRLDGDGFSPFGEVISGMEYVDAIEPKYGEKPDQGMLQSKGNEYLKAKFPDLDYIKKATIIVEEPVMVPATPAPAAEMKPAATPAPEATPAADAKPAEEMPAEKKPADPAPAETTPAAEPAPAATADPAMKKEEPASQPEETKPAPTGDTPATDKPAETPTTPVEP